MTLRISSELHDQLLDAANASPDYEICGLLIGNGQVDRICPTRNVAPDPERSFEIDPEQLFAAIRAERTGDSKLIGYYHSHPQGPPLPSGRDQAQASPDGRIWVIIGDGRVTAWSMSRANDFEPVDYVIVDVP
jgi:desampylase